MNRLLSVGVCIALGAASAGAGENPLQPKGEAFPFPKKATVVYPADGASTEKFGAQMLVDSLPRVNGGTYTLAADDADGLSGPLVNVGETRQFKALGEAAPDLNVDGYAIWKRGQNWYILGGSLSGPINGVTCLLEEDFGYRWYDSNDLPACGQRPKVNVVPRVYVPPFRFRQPYYNSSAVHGEWNGWNRVNPFEGSFDKRYGKRPNYADQYFVHTFAKIIPAEKYADRPEFFPLIDGERKINDGAQRNLIDHGLSDEVAGRLAELAAAQPEATIFSVSQADTREGWSEDPETQAFIEKEGYSGLLVDFLNRVAEKTALTNPELGVSTTAYQVTREPPKSLRPRDNVYIMLCNDAASGAFFTIDETESFAKAIEGWQALGARLHIWDYVVHFGHYPVPLPNLPNIGRNIELYQKYGVEGALELGSYNGRASSLEMLKCWVFAKKFWDPSRDVMDLARDFVDGYYGPAADDIMAYIELQNTYRDRFRAVGDHNRGKTVLQFLPREFALEARPLMESALAKTAGTPVHARVEREWFCVLYLQMFWGPTDPADTESYLEAIDWLEANQDRVGIQRLREDGVYKRKAYERFRRIARAQPLPKAGPGSVTLAAECAEGRPAVTVPDSDALSGEAMRQPKNCQGWSIQIPYEDVLIRVDAATEYILLARFRTDPVAEADADAPRHLFVVGNHVPAHPEDRREVDVAAVPGATYQTLAIARFVTGPTPYASGGMIFLSGNPDNPTENVYYDTFELARADEYREELPADLPVFNLR